MISSKQKPLNALLVTLMIIIAVLFAFPLYWVIATSLKSPGELTQTPPVFFPSSPQWENYATIVTTMPILRYLGNSFVLVGGTIAIMLITALPAAYALSRYRFRLRESYSNVVLAAQLFSPVVLTVPLYPMLSRAGLNNNYGVLILAYAVMVVPFVTWFLKDYFDTIPIELDEAGRVDGCSRFGALVRLILPAAKPGITSAVIFTFVMSWSQFVVPFILIGRSELFPVSVGLAGLRATTGEITTHYLAAGSVIGVAPVVILFVLLQRFIVAALTQGAVKG